MKRVLKVALADAGRRIRRSGKTLAVVLALLFASVLAMPGHAAAQSTPAAAAAIPAQLPGIGIAAHRPVFGGACKTCPWGAMADVVKAALVPYGYDLQICYHCFMGDAPRIVGDGRMPPPWTPHMGNGVIPDSYIPRPPNGHVEMGATADQILIAAYDGTGPYAKDGPRRQLRLLANIASPVYIIVAVRRGSGITDLAQLKDHTGPLKIVADADVSGVIFPYYGTSMDSLKAGGATFASSLVPAQRADAGVIIHYGNLANAPEFNIWYDASQREDLVYLQLPEALLAKLSHDLGLERRDIPTGLLRGQETPIHTVARSGTAIYGRADMPDDFAYTVAKALDEQQDLFEWSMGVFSYNRYRVTRVGDVPLHPGAARYYRERGYGPS
ncbi:MAG TPA: TAXI family TRAP transporter solute-binding subunit [Caulobacteraceae bacterium]